jgi:hypothetical protein
VDDADWVRDYASKPHLRSPEGSRREAFSVNKLWSFGGDIRLDNIRGKSAFILSVQILISLTFMACTSDSEGNVCERFEKIWVETHQENCLDDMDCCECFCADYGMYGSGVSSECNCMHLGDNCIEGRGAYSSAEWCLDDVDNCRAFYEHIIDEFCRVRYCDASSECKDDEVCSLGRCEDVWGLTYRLSVEEVYLDFVEEGGNGCFPPDCTYPDLQACFFKDFEEFPGEIESATFCTTVAYDTYRASWPNESFTTEIQHYDDWLFTVIHAESNEWTSLYKRQLRPIIRHSIHTGSFVSEEWPVLRIKIEHAGE